MKELLLFYNIFNVFMKEIAIVEYNNYRYK